MRRHAGQYPSRRNAESYAEFLKKQGREVVIEERIVFDVYTIDNNL